jgi:predicted permease
MSPRGLWRNLLRRAHVERELGDELQETYRLLVDEKVRAGMTLGEARRAARVELGGTGVIAENVRDVRCGAALEAVFQDICYALRGLRRSPGVSFVAVLTLALGIGATTALFSIVNAVLLNPFPGEGADRMVTIRLHGRNGPPHSVFLTARQLSALRSADVIDDAIATDTFVTTRMDGDLPEIVRTQYYSANAFNYFGLSAQVGRLLVESDGPPGEEPRRVAVLTDSYWRSHYGGRSDAIGQILHLDHVAYAVIGVSPGDFAPGIDVIVPIHLKLDPSYAWGIQARLKPEIDVRAAGAALQPLFESFAKESPARFPQDLRVEVARLVDERRTAPFAPTLILVLVAAGVLLLVACVTTSILILARGASRRHELEVRHALGANRSRLVRQLLTESLVLGCTGTACGVALAYWSAPFVLEWLPPNALPLRLRVIPLDWSLLVLSVALAVGSSVLFGVLPALSLTRRRATSVQGGASKVLGRVEGGRAHHAFVAAQVALTVLLLSGTGAATRGLLALYHTSLGYDPANVLRMTVMLPEGSHADWSERARFFDRLRAQMEATPQVVSVGISNFGMPPRIGGRFRIEIPGQAVPGNLFPHVQRIDDGYFSALKIPLVRGRLWSRAETLRAAPVAVVNRTMARILWRDGNPIGARIRVPELEKSTSQFVLAAPNADGWVEIVGVVGDVPNVGLREPPIPAMYVPHTVMLSDQAAYMVRTTVDPLTLVQSIREQVRAVDPTQAVWQFGTAEQALAMNGWARERFVMFLLLAFGGFALTLATIGLFSVVSYAVSQRVREFGVRLALGAGGGNIVRLALASPLLSILGGLAAGCGLSVAANGVLARWSIGNLADPLVLAGVAAVFLFASMVAVLMPTGRALSIEPARALRME